MAQDITLLGASYTDVPAVDLPKTGGGTARFTDATPTTATESDVLLGKVFLLADGSLGYGTAVGASPSGDGAGFGGEVKPLVGEAVVGEDITGASLTVSKGLLDLLANAIAERTGASLPMTIAEMIARSLT